MPFTVIRLKIERILDSCDSASSGDCEVATTFFNSVNGFRSLLETRSEIRWLGSRPTASTLVGEVSPTARAAPPEPNPTTTANAKKD